MSAEAEIETVSRESQPIEGSGNIQRIDRKYLEDSDVESGDDDEDRIDGAAVLVSMHLTTLQRFVDVVNAYAGDVQPPEGLVISIPVTPETLMLAILDYLRGAGTPNESAAPIGLVCLPCTPAELGMVVFRAADLQRSEWYVALKDSAPEIVIGPIASLWTTNSRCPNGELTSIVPLPRSPTALWD